MARTHTYHADWLDAGILVHERRRLQRWLQRRQGRVQAESILRDLEQACHERRSLSAILLHGSRIVGCLVAMRAAGRDAGAAAGARSASGIRILALVTHAHHRCGVSLLLLRLAALYRERSDLWNLPLWLDGTPQETAALQRRRAWRRLGLKAAIVDDPQSAVGHVLELRRAAPFEGARIPELVSQLSQPRSYATPAGTLTVGVITTRRGWDALEPHWNQLLRATPEATVFQTFEFQRLWWNHVGWGNELLLQVALRGDRPVAILPLQRDPRHWCGAEFRTLSFLGDAPESDRPRLLYGPDDTALPGIMVRDLMARSDEWDELALVEQSSSEPFTRALCAALEARGYHVRHGEPMEAPRIVLDGSWPDYLRSRSRALRKSLRRKRQKLEQQGRPQMVMTTVSGDGHALEEYLAVERSSWKNGSNIGVLRDEVTTALHREAVERLAASYAVEFRFLRVNDRTIAATFGIVWRDTWYSLHIAHDRAWDDCSPGVLLTALEVEEAFGAHRYRVFDFLSGALTNKREWANDRVITRDLHAVRTGPVCSALFLTYFVWKPALKRALASLRQWWARTGNASGRTAKGHDDDATRHD